MAEEVFITEHGWKFIIRDERNEVLEWLRSITIDEDDDEAEVEQPVTSSPNPQEDDNAPTVYS